MPTPTPTPTTAPLTIGELRDDLNALCDALDPSTPVAVANKAYGGRNDYRAHHGLHSFRSCTAPMVVHGLTDDKGKDATIVLLPH